MIAAVRVLALCGLLLVPAWTVRSWVGAAVDRGELAAAAPAQQAAVAAAADEGYCSPELKLILRRVLQSCGLAGSQGGVRGCQPVQARNVATVSGADFNALFQPMQHRGGIIQFDVGDATLDDADVALIDELFADQRGASWFFVVARASPEGSVDFNRDLSRRRAEAVMVHLKEKFADPDLDREVGLLWLGEEYAQLDEQFCQWRRSSEAECRPQDINRSAFVSWIDCRL